MILVGFLFFMSQLFLFFCFCFSFGMFSRMCPPVVYHGAGCAANTARRQAVDGEAEAERAAPPCALPHQVRPPARTSAPPPRPGSTTPGGPAAAGSPDQAWRQAATAPSHSVFRNVRGPVCFGTASERARSRLLPAARPRTALASGTSCCFHLSELHLPPPSPPGDPVAPRSAKPACRAVQSPRHLPAIDMAGGATPRPRVQKACFLVLFNLILTIISIVTCCESLHEVIILLSNSVTCYPAIIVQGRGPWNRALCWADMFRSNALSPQAQRFYNLLFFQA